MIRIHIKLSGEEHEAAKREAERLYMSMSELLRFSLLRMLSITESKPWMRYAGLAESGDSQSSVRIDDVVYREKD